MTEAGQDNHTRIALTAAVLLLLLPAAGAVSGCRRAAVNQNAPVALQPPTPEITPAPSPRRVPEKVQTMRFPPRYEAEAKKSINARLNTWRKTIETRDLEKHLDHYADQIEIYYNASNVNREFVAADRRRAFERFDSLKIQLINENVHLESKDAATVVLDKSWDFKNAAGFSNGLVQQEIKLQRIERQWRIVSEKDLEVYRLHNQ